MISRIKTILRPYAKKMIKKGRSAEGENQPIYYKHSYAVEGEDMILAHIFRNVSCGFYVDVGAHHPQKYSNTYYFYEHGWRGMNIDAMPGSMTLFNRLRPRDINLEVAISNIRQTMQYYVFNEPALNGFCQKLATEYNKIAGNALIAQQEIETKTLAEIFDLHLPEHQAIDFLNVDVEGLEYDALVSNNWRKYRPKIVLVEALEPPYMDQEHRPRIIRFLEEQNYRLYAQTVLDLIFKEQTVSF